MSRPVRRYFYFAVYRMSVTMSIYAQLSLCLWALIDFTSNEQEIGTIRNISSQRKKTSHEIRYLRSQKWESQSRKQYLPPASPPIFWTIDISVHSWSASDQFRDALMYEVLMAISPAENGMLMDIAKDFSYPQKKLSSFSSLFFVYCLVQFALWNTTKGPLSVKSSFWWIKSLEDSVIIASMHVYIYSIILSNFFCMFLGYLNQFLSAHGSISFFFIVISGKEYTLL